MPSGSLITFRYNLTDVDRLIGAYEALRPGDGQGRRGLGHITRACILTLCTAWEQYIEDLAIEAANLLREQFESPDQLPKPVQKMLSRKVKNAKHELKPLELAGEGWRAVYLAYAHEEVASLHSPKAENIEQLFKEIAGIEDSIGDCWSFGRENLDTFVATRNRVAHKGRAAGRYVKFHEVAHNRDGVRSCVAETDSFLADYLSEVLPEGRPWRRGRV